MTREQLLILVVLGLVLLSNVVARVLRRWVGGEVPRTRESEVSEIPRPARRPPSVEAPRRFPAVPDTTPVPVAMSHVAPRPRARATLGGLPAVRRGIVLMTILGPCRALEPPGPQA
jgi:hypothetical protein